MSAGLPLIVTDVGGNREAVVAGETGLIVPPHDPLGLAAAIIHLAQHPEVRQRFGIAGRKLVESSSRCELAWRSTMRFTEVY